MSTVILTKAAAYEVKSMMEQNGMPEGFLRISVKGGGCTGLSYGMSAEESPADNDEVLNFYDVKVLVDKADAPILKGTTVDFKQSLMGGGFAIENPNAIASCGCGSSFRTKDVAGTPENC
ncbi:iron-sulfur cluster assembly accessory protein [Macrococcoides caseolyticum]|uniref:Iron-sulfur cluster assembly accessory protein n=1 Tax=Macrococcoides caseolyticum TaxID=69966 RepID=A0A855GMW4_9STAP|nr:iron-sulfur cluster assembly accessory protein [Macrococcus caseolyticus]ARQ03988.1 Iron-sulfur cluster insertion protein ErpA [Macrococcus caseolyticus]PKE07764.1 iron-sulfur cluster assembly accessory protein [Macrococcus caseolyticus]PKE22050.1 iron-sulfur cluster assembly accessory protein [Macrococcus caseolyticus]PKE24209.1 iron-sulfur cluster assembly accessory protein [Macrococcus caseolyticus]PKE27364.1 iron-sulfur cluster assembly accessory protein [Macrococcus caseolyticus]